MTAYDKLVGSLNPTPELVLDLMHEIRRLRDLLAVSKGSAFPSLSLVVCGLFFDDSYNAPAGGQKDFVDAALVCFCEAGYAGSVSSLPVNDMYWSQMENLLKFVHRYFSAESAIYLIREIRLRGLPYDVFRCPILQDMVEHYKMYLLE